MSSVDGFGDDFRQPGKCGFAIRKMAALLGHCGHLCGYASGEVARSVGVLTVRRFTVKGDRKNVEQPQSQAWQRFFWSRT
jgi:hypothetical protein